MVKNVQQRIEDFLGLTVPPGILVGVDGRLAEVERELQQTDIQELVPERPPRLYVRKAVIYRIGEDRWIIVPFAVTEEMCLGHFPGFLCLPLADAGFALAQTAEVLVAYTAKVVLKQEGPLTPVVFRVGKVAAEGKDFVVPGDTVSLVARGRTAKFNSYMSDTFGYLVEQCIFSMPDVLHVVTNDQRLWRKEERREQQ